MKKEGWIFVTLALVLVLALVLFLALGGKNVGLAVGDCVDSDNGTNTYVFGTACIGTTCFNDSCYNSSVLKEAYCMNSTAIALRQYTCFYGCESGICKSSPICTPSASCSALGYVCGIWLNGTCSGTLNCGTCTSGYVCNSSGICIFNNASGNVSSCTPTSCSGLGYQCGIWGNGTCSGTLNCGTCASGYTCNSSGTCTKTSWSSAGCSTCPFGYYTDVVSVYQYKKCNNIVGYQARYDTQVGSGFTWGPWLTGVNGSRVDDPYCYRCKGVISFFGARWCYSGYENVAWEMKAISS